jgi:hypothetical protein
MEHWTKICQAILDIRIEQLFSGLPTRIGLQFTIIRHDKMTEANLWRLTHRGSQWKAGKGKRTKIKQREEAVRSTQLCLVHGRRIQADGIRQWKKLVSNDGNQEPNFFSKNPGCIGPIEQVTTMEEHNEPKWRISQMTIWVMSTTWLRAVDMIREEDAFTPNYLFHTLSWKSSKRKRKREKEKK